MWTCTFVFFKLDKLLGLHQTCKSPVIAANIGNAVCDVKLVYFQTSMQIKTIDQDDDAIALEHEELPKEFRGQLHFLVDCNELRFRVADWVMSSIDSTKRGHVRCCKAFTLLFIIIVYSGWGSIITKTALELLYRYRITLECV